MAGRDFFSNQIKKTLLGPGSDVFALPEQEEVISEYPLQRYYTGILFPEKTINSPDELDGREELGEKEDDDIENVRDEKQDAAESKNQSSSNKDEETFIAANQYFPTNIGLTVCLQPQTKEIEILISGAYYKLATPSETKIAFSMDEKDALYQKLSDDIKSRLKFEDNALFFTSEPKGNTKGGRTEDYAIPQKLHNSNEVSLNIIDKFERLLTPSSRLWKRVPFSQTIKIDTTAKNSRTTLVTEGDRKLDLLTKTINDDRNGNRYLKCLLYNASPEHPQNRFTNSDTKLNRNSFFQVNLSITNSAILPYKQPSFSINQFDQESNLINYQYRSIKEYAIGHGCCIYSQKENNKISISTTFLPEIDLPLVSNKLEENPFFNTVEQNVKTNLNHILEIKQLSIWSALDDKTVFHGLKAFVSMYENWISIQKHKANYEPEYKDYSAQLVSKQENTLQRLSESIDLLENNTDAYECFRYANTAMYIQLVTSSDNRFARKHKELKEITDNKGVYDNLDFFKDYNQSFFTYRPFQLAFFLLNLKSIINPSNSEERNLVDLLWFPTGGGKTEAYLAVSAFTILWRRLINLENYQGVSVIMRYTLRLLTSQQFERASRLISALEFLRVKSGKFGNNRITIGMWVGAATSPNSFDDAKLTHKNIEDEKEKLNKGKNGNPEDRNNFQIQACPWCGCKVISQNQKTGKFNNAFTQTGEVKCLNDDCHFSDLRDNEIPVYVVDEYLYQNPPTLLFATVDKFAMLSHKPQGHNFFNSLNDELLPPDLIIQDELHLLNGPLGSVVGLFERLIEELCTKNGIKPKIIASTATTRNTDLQIRNLYNRNVAVFPPSGIHYNDSFFAYTLSKSKRKYIGFMPTGKTGMDSQLKLLANLLYARSELLQSLRKQYGANQNEIWKDLDPYYTIVSYYNSLRDVGKTYNKVNDEIYNEYRRLLKHFNKDNYLYNFMNSGLVSRTEELTSRVPSNKIKQTLDKLEEPLSVKKISEEQFSVEKGVDLVLASNMISVGIDVGRLNIMLINGQPRNVAEYIQASSRVARSNEGIVLNLLDANRAREKSHFENFHSFHHAYYKFVEPLSLTPNTEITFDKMLNSILVGYVRHKLGKQAHDFVAEDVLTVENLIKSNIGEIQLETYLTNRLKVLAENWLSKIITANNVGETLRYNGERHALISKSEPWNLMFSMREIDKQGVILIND